MDDAIQIDLALDNGLERGPGAVLDHLRIDLPVTSINAKDNRFPIGTPSPFSLDPPRPKERFRPLRPLP